VLLASNVFDAIEASEIVPVLVIVPPVRPVPVATLVTVPVPAGKSAAVSARNVGAAAAPVVGPANTSAADCVARDAVRVPAEVTGEFVTVKIEGIDSPTLVTLPVAALTQLKLPVPSVESTWPVVPEVAGRVIVYEVVLAAA
jgi:hypothetical protein